MAITIQEFAPVLEEVIWSLPAEELAASEPAVRSLLVVAGIELRLLLAEFCDETLARCVQKGFLRRPAFEEWLVNRYETALRRWFYSRTRSWDRVEDLVQEVYLKLLTPSVLARYNADWPFRPWLWSVVGHFWIDQVRRNTHPAEPIVPEQPGREVGPVEQAMANELRSRADHVLAGLPQPQRQVFQHLWQGETPDQVAACLQMSKPKVYRLLFQARRTLERALGPLDGCDASPGPGSQARPSGETGQP